MRSLSRGVDRQDLLKPDEDIGREQGTRQTVGSWLGNLICQLRMTRIEAGFFVCWECQVICEQGASNDSETGLFGLYGECIVGGVRGVASAKC